VQLSYPRKPNLFIVDFGRASLACCLLTKLEYVVAEPARLQYLLSSAFTNTRADQIKEQIRLQRQFNGLAKKKRTGNGPRLFVWQANSRTHEP